MTFGQPPHRYAFHAPALRSDYGAGYYAAFVAVVVDSGRYRLEAHCGCD